MTAFKLLLQHNTPDEKMTTPQHKYNCHKGNAKHRNIDFDISSDEWWKIWQDSGHWHERGKGMGKYVMSRPGDLGAYHKDNVAIITQSQNLSEAHKGKKATDEHKRKMSESHMGEKNPMFGKIARNKGIPMSEEQKRKISETKKGQIGFKHKSVQCPYCSVIGGLNNMKRYHFDKCKEK